MKQQINTHNFTHWLSLLLTVLIYFPISAQPVNGQPGENIWHLIAGIGTEVDFLAACVANPITSETTISVSGNYCLMQSFTGNITIEASNTVIDMNGRDITGIITANAPYSEIKNGTIFMPAVRSNRATRTGAITIHANNIDIINCTMLGLTATDTFLHNGCSGVVDDFADAPVTRDNITIQSCRITGGQGLTDPTGFSGDGGIGISLNGNNNVISECYVQGGAGGSSLINQAGFGGVGLADSNGKNIIIRNSTFIGGNSGTGFVSGSVVRSAGGGVTIPQNSFLITHCTIQGGQGLDNVSGDGNSGGRGLLTGNGSQGGIIENSFISGGNGGSTSNNSPDTAGKGGEGIEILGNSKNIKIRNSTILSSGNGGSGFNAGDGADGILILGSLPKNVEITHCTISSTGTAGVASGGTAGTPGRAITDNNTDFDSIIFSNFAYDIANTSTRYIIRNSGTAVVSTGISAYSTSPIPNFLDNVFVP